MTTDKTIRLSRWIAALSFLFGTAIFVGYYITGNSTMMLWGYGYILAAGVVNIVFVSLLYSKSKENAADRKRVFKTMRIMLANIPLVLCYCYFAIVLSNFVRLTLVNVADTKISNLTLKGCETKEIAHLNPGDEREVWVSVQGDCAIDVFYTKQGQIWKETVVGYAPSLLQNKVKYKIGGGAKLNTGSTHKSEH